MRNLWIWRCLAVYAPSSGTQVGIVESRGRFRLVLVERQFKERKYRGAGRLKTTNRKCWPGWAALESPMTLTACTFPSQRPPPLTEIDFRFNTRCRDSSLALIPPLAPTVAQVWPFYQMHMAHHSQHFCSSDPPWLTHCIYIAKTPDIFHGITWDAFTFSPIPRALRD